MDLIYFYPLMVSFRILFIFVYQLHLPYKI